MPTKEVVERDRVIQGDAGGGQRLPQIVCLLASILKSLKLTRSPAYGCFGSAPSDHFYRAVWVFITLRSATSLSGHPRTRQTSLREASVSVRYCGRVPGNDQLWDRKRATEEVPDHWAPTFSRTAPSSR